MGIKIGITKTVQVEATAIKVSVKCTDHFHGQLIDQDGQNIGAATEDGSVPSFFPGRHYGEYLELDIDLATGKILNWTPPTAEQVEAYANGNE